MRLSSLPLKIYFLSGIIGLASGFGWAQLPTKKTTVGVNGPFVNMERNGNGGVFDIGRQRFMMITPGYFVASARIVKTKSKTLYVFVDDIGLHIVNALNGDHLRDLPFYKMPRLNAFNRAHAELEFHADVDGDSVAVLPALEKRAWRGVSELPWLRLNLNSGKIETGELASPQAARASGQLDAGVRAVASTKKSDRET